MLLITALQKFILKFRQNLFYFKDGFFVLPYLANSPKMIIDSVSWMPFVQLDPKKNLMKSSNSFSEGVCHYEELENGLWIMLTDFIHKKNVSFKLIYDKTLPIDYYTLSLYRNETRRIAPSSLIDNMVNIDKGWMLHKPGSEAINGHFAGSRALFLNIYFSQDWLYKNSKENKVFASEELDKWLASDKKSLFLSELFKDANHIAEPIIKTILTKGDQGVQDIIKLKIQTLELMSFFIQKTKEPNFNIKHDVLTNPSRRKILKAEKKLSDTIFEGFPGISNIASEIGMSETKLKKDFKSTYGHTMFHYFQCKQMKAAQEILLKDPELKIAHVSSMLGYLNASKFSASFRKCLGYLPSELHNRHVV